MQHDAEKHLVDVLQAAKDVFEFTDRLSFDEYHASKLVKSAVERKFEIIGEAISRLSKAAPATAEKIREFEKLLHFGI